MDDANKVSYQTLSEEKIREEIDNGNLVEYMKRRIKCTELIDDEEKQSILISDIKRYEVPKKTTPGIKERLLIPKFGLCTGQAQGSIENGIVRNDAECRIVNRKKQVYNEGLKERLKNSTDIATKEEFLRRMLEEQEKKRNDNAFKQVGLEEKKIKRRRDRPASIKITGFSKRCEEEDLRKLFSEVGDVGGVHILRDRVTGEKRGIAFLHFRQTAHIQEAIDRFDNKTIGNSVWQVCKVDEDN